ncbi:MAG: FMN-dependent alpha-hydroxy acid dehydrogenase [Bryobacterales bacterium]|nr:FMN-dependent alpha-hydroxy acid dehydrogenase [Bryobacterales bacterium]
MLPKISAKRRAFLRFLAASPLAARAWAQQNSAAISRAADALSVSDFETLARGMLPPAHLGYLMSGVDDDATLKLNREGFQHYQLRARRLVDVSKPDLRTEVFGVPWETPIFLCPVGGQKMFQAEGEVAVARAAKAKKATQILSTVSSSSVEDVARALGGPLWYQLYMPVTWEGTEKMVRRAEDAGCPVLVWTVDLLGGRNTETAERLRRTDTRNCLACHTNGVGSLKGRAMFEGIEGGINPPAANWSYMDRLRKLTKMKLIIKGIDTAEDARLCREHGADAVVVSNHGGRATETLRSTIESLAEVVDAVGSQLPVLVDGGFRRGTDIYKALALGARAVGIGRPYIFGLTAFGQEGVERVIDILRAELRLTMQQCGTPSIKDITRAAVRPS